MESRQVLPGQFLRAVYPQDRVWVHVLLFCLTLLTTTLVGVDHYVAWTADFRQVQIQFSWPLLAEAKPAPQIPARPSWPLAFFVVTDCRL